MKIEGIEGMSPERVRQEVERGGPFVIYQYCISVLIMTFRRNSPVYFLKGGESAVGKGLKWTLLSLCLGWWGIPWGLIYTPMSLFTNLRGGKDVTASLMPSLTQANSAQSSPPQPGVWPPPPDFTT